MNITWKKMGKIFAPSGDGFFKTHATRPIPYKMAGNVLRLFFTSRDYDDRMIPTYIDVDVNNPSHVLDVQSCPVVNLGQIGMFDDSSVVLNSFLDVSDVTYFYYTGWKRRRINVPFEFSIGILKWDRTSPSLERLYAGPIISQDRNHPFFAAAPFVIHENDRFRMWYCNGTGWRVVGDTAEPLYTVFYAESRDGITWEPQNKPVIDYKFEGEVVSAPWVIKIRDKYHMWYSTRGSGSREEKNYTVGYAESPDGINWTRLDDRAGIDKSETGWDSEMVCYPSFFPHGDIVYMFYSGNHVGRGGIGYAIAENFLI